MVTCPSGAKYGVCGLILAVTFVAAGCGARDAVDEFPVLTGDYLGQAPPGAAPEMFAPGIVTTGMYTRDVAMTPDGNEFYFCAVVGRYSYASILVSKRVDGRWTEPEVAPFSGSPDWMDIEPAISHDGQRFYFLSTRPVGDEEPGQQDIWVMDREGDGWSEPRNLGLPVNTEAGEFFPSVTRDGTLYFTRSDPQTGVHTIWRARPAGDGFQEPERLDDTINAAGRARFNAFIAADESYLVLPVHGLEDSRGGVDYYISFRDENDRWSEPLNMGDSVNSAAATEWSAYVSPDGKYVFFMSDRVAAGQDAAERSYADVLAGLEAPGNGSAGIYWVDAGFIDRLREVARDPDGARAEVEEVEPASVATDSTLANPEGLPPWGETFPVLRGEYLGQARPGSEPTLFAPGIVSNALGNRDLAITPDGKEIFFGVAFGRRVAVAHTRQVDGVWTEPDFAPFSRDPELACFEPALSADGNRLYFLSNRAAAGQEVRPGWGNQNIFRVTREGDGWSEPEALPAPITTDGFEYYPSLTASGTLYFTKSDRGGNASIARSRLVDGAYEEPVVLGPEVNVGEDNVNAFVARDESYLITCVRGSEQNIGEVDYYIAFRGDDDRWTEAVNLGEPINLPGTRASSSSVSPDGRYFFFASDRTNEGEILIEGKLTRDVLLRLHGGPRNGTSDIYWMDAGFIEELRSRAIPGDTPGAG